MGCACRKTRAVAAASSVRYEVVVTTTAADGTTTTVSTGRTFTSIMQAQMYANTRQGSEVRAVG